MRFSWLLAALLLPLSVCAQTIIPAGTILPVRLDSSLNAQHLRPGDMVKARVMQNIPGTSIRRGARVEGRVMSASAHHLRLQFTAVVSHGRRYPITTNLRALASMMEVQQAFLPQGAPARGLPPEDWNTRQIGGDEVYRGGGHVMRGDTVVGEPTPYGVRGHLIANGKCRAAVAGNSGVQAFWIFSTDACGVYGIPGLQLDHAGRTAPVGTIELTSKSVPLLVRGGSGWLLRVARS